MNEKQIAQQIIEGLGGSDNINSIEYCMTRLRVVIREASKVNTNGIKSISGVIGVLSDGQSIQVVLGPGTAQGVANCVSELQGINLKIVEENDTEKPTVKKNLLHAFNEIFTPIIPALIGSGLVAGFGKFLQSLGVDANLGIMKAFNVVGFAFFGFIIIIVAMNTAKVCGGSPILGAVAGSILINPALSGMGIVPGRGGVIGAMLAGVLMAIIEKYTRKISPKALKVHFPPTISVLVAGLIIVYLLQPVTGYLADLLVNAVLALLKVGGAVAGACISALFLPLVMTGLHHGLTPVHLELIKQVGYSQLQTMNSMAGAGQVGAAIALFLKYRNSMNLKDTIKGSLPVGILGIGEPLIYGVTLPLGKPFITACLGAGIGGAFVGAVGLGARGVYVSGILGVVIATNPIHYIMAYLLAVIFGFIFTYSLKVPEDLINSLGNVPKLSSKA
ncbi:MAG TPA: PTS transporter subunit EIIC [Clostridia bacterium]|nr:PTS transporter subunit EIIC [Clostridia bacterium]